MDNTYNDHRALSVSIPPWGTPDPHKSTLPNNPTTRDHPPFLLPIPKPHIDIYRQGDTNAKSTHDKTSDTLQRFPTSDTTTTKYIDKATSMVILTIGYYTHGAYFSRTVRLIPCGCDADPSYLGTVRAPSSL